MFTAFSHPSCVSFRSRADQCRTWGNSSRSLKRCHRACRIGSLPTHLRALASGHAGNTSFCVLLAAWRHAGVPGGVCGVSLAGTPGRFTSSGSRSLASSENRMSEALSCFFYGESPVQVSAESGAIGVADALRSALLHNTQPGGQHGCPWRINSVLSPRSLRLCSTRLLRPLWPVPRAGRVSFSPSRSVAWSHAVSPAREVLGAGFSRGRNSTLLSAPSSTDLLCARSLGPFVQLTGGLLFSDCTSGIAVEYCRPCSARLCCGEYDGHIRYMGLRSRTVCSVHDRAERQRP